MASLHSSMRNVAGDSDQSLLERAWAGDRAAFGLLYQKHGEVYRFALQMSGSVPLAEEVTQEVFLALVSERGRFDANKGDLSSYLYGMTRNRIRRQWERDRRYVAHDLDEEGGDVPTEDEDVLTAMTRRESIEAVRQAVLTLPPVYREVVVLCELHEQSYAAAAQVVGCAVGTVRSRLHRARGLLAQKLQSGAAASATRVAGGQS